MVIDVSLMFWHVIHVCFHNQALLQVLNAITGGISEWSRMSLLQRARCLSPLSRSSDRHSAPWISLVLSSVSVSKLLFRYGNPWIGHVTPIILAWTPIGALNLSYQAASADIARFGPNLALPTD